MSFIIGRELLNIGILARRRNKTMTGLVVYQGLRATEIMQLQIKDVRLREGKIWIAGTKRSNERTLALQSKQVFDLLDYINTTRKQIIAYRKLNTVPQELFLNLGGSDNTTNTLQMMLVHLRQINSKVKTLEQLRASVIVQWLKQYHLRKVQIMAGHRYISSTEKYKANNLEDLKEDIRNYHPF